MKLVLASSNASVEQTGSVETVVIARAHLDFLGRISREINPKMPLEFGIAHIVRTLLERLEDANVEGTAAGLRR